MKPVWKVLESHVEFSPSPRIVVSREVVELPDGRVVPDYYKIRLSPFALVLAETDDRSIVFLEQYRHGPARIVLTLPGGHLEQGEDVLDAARRELLEETGYSVEHCERLGSFNTLGNQSGSFCTVFHGTRARKVAEPQSDDLEEAEVRLVKRDDVVQAIVQERFGCAGDLAAIGLFLARVPS